MEAPNQISSDKLRIILSRPQLAYEHSAQLDEVLPECESVIATNAKYSVLYAANVLGERFSLGEPVIAKDPQFAFEYARSVIRGPWPEGEEAISKEGFFSIEYSLNILRAPFPLGEDAIGQNPHFSFRYAYFMLGGPFPKGEAIIETDMAVLINYKMIVLNLNAEFDLYRVMDRTRKDLIGYDIHNIRGISQNEEAKMNKLFRLALTKANRPPKKCEWTVDRNKNVYFCIRF